MPFRHTDFEPELVKLLGAIWKHVCEEFSVTDDERRQEVAREMIRAVLNGTTDPDVLAAVAITWILKHRPLEPTPKGDGNGLKAKKR
jgi:hypothetical protein